MQSPALLFLAVLSIGTLLAQQPVAVGKVHDSSRNYHGADGTSLDKNSSDSELQRSLDASVSNDPELRNVQVAVHHHNATLTGLVTSKRAKSRAEELVAHTEGVRNVRNHLKVGEGQAERRETLSTEAH